MANEAVLVNRLEHPVDYTVANATGIEKGTLLKLTTPKTAIISSAKNDPLAGVAAREKIASDGRTQLAVFKRGYFMFRFSGACTVGWPVSSYADANYPNVVGVASGAAVSGAAILGIADETAADGETRRVYVNIGCGGNLAA